MSQLLSTLVLVFDASAAYYFSANEYFGWDGARAYCQDICHNDLASVINHDQQLDIQNTIISRKSSPFWASNQNLWIGLYKPSSNDTWTWSDNQTITPSSMASYPWSKPSLYNKSTANQCVTINYTTYSWETNSCSLAHGPFLCNHCDGILNKYALIPQGACKQIYDTSLAIIIDTVNPFNLSNAYHLYNIHGGNAWIGMRVEDVNNISTYIWNDGTPYDFGTGYDPSTCIGTCTPWIDDGPDGNGLCVQITPNGWNTAPCDQPAYAVCKLPSELRLDLNNWTVISGKYEFLDNQGMRTVNTEDIGLRTDDDDNLVALLDKYWYNKANERLLIEYRFSIDFKDEIEGKSAGIVIFNGAEICQSYYVCITKNVDGYFLVLYRVFGPITIPLSYVPLQFAWIDGKFYVMLIEINKGNQFKITLNQHVLEYNDTTNMNVLSAASGFIGIFSSNAIDVASKWLYISGTPLLVQNENNATNSIAISCPFTFDISNSIHLTTTTSDPTMEPTFEPTLNPTINPTINPTVNPTRNPTINPTIFPSQTPSSSPSSTTAWRQTLVIDKTASSTTSDVQIVTDSVIIPTITPSQDGGDMVIVLKDTDSESHVPLQISVVTMGIFILVLGVLVFVLLYKNKRLKKLRKKRNSSILERHRRESARRVLENIESGSPLKKAVAKPRNSTDPDASFDQIYDNIAYDNFEFDKFVFNKKTSIGDGDLCQISEEAMDHDEGAVSLSTRRAMLNAADQHVDEIMFEYKWKQNLIDVGAGDGHLLTGEDQDILEEKSEDQEDDDDEEDEEDGDDETEPEENEDIEDNVEEQLQAMEKAKTEKGSSISESVDQLFEANPSVEVDVDVDDINFSPDDTPPGPGFFK